MTIYFEDAPAERPSALRKLHEPSQTHLTGFTENIEYGGPTYLRNGEVEVGFASQKHFIRLYILRKEG